MQDCQLALGVGVFILGLVALLGFFITKKKGFGAFNTSALLLILVMTISPLLYLAGLVEGKGMDNLLFAVIGFAGGLFATKGREVDDPDKGTAHDPSDDRPKG